MVDRSQLTGRGKRIRGLSLRKQNGDVVSIPRQRRSLVLVLTHPDSCPECLQYVKQLEEYSAELASWDADVAIVTRETNGSQESRPWTVFDPERRVEAAAEIDSPGLVLVDQWGEVTDVRAAGEQHAFPLPTKVVSWARYLAIRCPECEGEAL